VYAALERLTVDPEQAPAAAEALVSDILPRVRSAAASSRAIGLSPPRARVICSSPQAPLKIGDSVVRSAAPSARR
jgi:hypothetical protein